MKHSDSTTHRSTGDRGFTILEILVTVVILAILATVVVLSVRNTADNAADAAAATDAKVLDHAEESFRVLHGRYASEDELVSGRFIEEPSSIHDITIGGDGEYQLVRVDGTSTTTSKVTTTTSRPTTTTAAATTTTARATTTTAAPTTTAAAVTTTAAAVAPTGVSCSFVVDSAWGSGGNGNLSIVNNSGRALATWTARVDRGSYGLTLWNAKVVSSDATSVTVTNLSWNGAVPPASTGTPTGGSVSGSGIAVGLSLPCTVLPNPVTAAKTSCTFVVTSAWNTGGNGELRITNSNSLALSSWTVRITRNGYTLSLWSANDSSTGTTFVTASNQSHNASVAAGATTVVTGGAVGGTGVTNGMTLPCQVTDAS